MGGVISERAAALGVFATGIACTFLLAGAAARGATQTLRVTTRLVVVNVVAHNGKHEAVTGLARGDFTILDNGKPQQISIFSVERSDAKHSPEKPLPPNVFSNRIARNGRIPANLAVILLDAKDTGFADSVFARNAVMKFIQQMPPGEHIALYVLGNWGLSVIQDFTSNPSPLLEAIRNYHGSLDAESTTPGPTLDLGMVPHNHNDAVARLQADMRDSTPPDLAGYRTGDGFKVIEALAHHLSGVPGRKSLIWVADRLPFPAPGHLFNLSNSGMLRELHQAMSQTIQALNQADVAVYPVDAHGLVVGPLNKGLYKPGLPPPPWGGEIWTLNMDDWAKQTGGRAFYYTNGLTHAIFEALDDSKVTYTLGYYPKDITWNGKYRHIKVRVDRKGVHLRYRQGYYASTGAENLRAKPVNLLAAAAASPLDSSGLGITVRLTRMGQPPSLRLKAAIYVDGRGLTFQPEHGRYDVSFMVWAGQYSKQGRQLAAKSKKVSFKLSPANYHAALKGGLGLTVQETLKPGAWKLGVAVLDTASGTTGSVRIPLHRQSGLGGERGASGRTTPRASKAKALRAI